MIVLARHGCTIGYGGRCIGRKEVPLSKRGGGQADQLCHDLSGIPFERLCCSPSKRALDTMAPLALHLSKRVEVLPALNEINMGSWEGVLFDDIKEQHPEEYLERGKCFGSFRAPGGESFNDVAARVMPVLESLASGETPVLVMTHAGVIRSVLCHVTGHPMNDLFQFSPEHAQCTVLDNTDDGFQIVAENVSAVEVATLLMT
ncbi:histidine phosphatase family protein [Pseudodesulfovibrio sp. zrk46]|uniref:histidine phosphatase family protein n=1 Tax=Pseudodesulfovibrio sp. zrk46 TaxID=2725288 RepID=UPI001448B7FE|nr:histidine phosphatase family protein [Pseudodesulfovibrio sp. zrk46]QJB57426.1 histidine phosphatase family protein [Pseudodesulfovibrio sp. zrk46]